MSRRFSTLLLTLALGALILQVISLNLLPGQPSGKSDTLLNNRGASLTENPAPQSPGPALPVPLTPLDAERQLRLAEENQQSRIPATPADPYSYAEAWEVELASLQDVENPVVVIWRKNLYLAYDAKKGVPPSRVEAEVRQRVRVLEPRFERVLVSPKSGVRKRMLAIQEKVRLGKSPSPYLNQLEADFKR